MILPVRDEEESLPAVIAEAREVLAGLPVVLAAGLNGCGDGSRAVLERLGVLCGETGQAGYGHGCRAAIEAVRERHGEAAGWIFLAADGANDPRDIPALIAAHREGAELVLGNRTGRPSNWPVLGAAGLLGNLALAAWAGLLTGRWFIDIAPLRLIDGRLYERMGLREWTWGWTIEAQVLAARLGARIAQRPAADRPRRAGRQKVSGVSWSHTLRVARHMARAAWNARRRRL